MLLLHYRLIQWLNTIHEVISVANLIYGHKRRLWFVASRNALADIECVRSHWLSIIVLLKTVCILRQTCMFLIWRFVRFPLVDCSVQTFSTNIMWILHLVWQSWCPFGNPVADLVAGSWPVVLKWAGGWHQSCKFLISEVMRAAH